MAAEATRLLPQEMRTQTHELFSFFCTLAQQSEENVFNILLKLPQVCLIISCSGNPAAVLLVADVKQTAAEYYYEEK